MIGEDEKLRLMLTQQADRADRMWRSVPGRFLAGGEKHMALHEAHERGLAAAFDGGIEDAERVQVCMYPPEEEPVFELAWVQAAWDDRFGTLTHRDLFGSLMALGIDRRYFGDLILQQGKAYLVTTPDMARRLPMEWTQAGNRTITVIALEEPPEIQREKGSEFRDTVASLRLDSIVASGLKLSRSKAADLIRAEKVQVDHTVEARCDRMLTPGALLSIRGFGRIRLLSAGEETRKGRIPVLLEIFGQTK